MREFSLKKAKAGAELCTRDGRDARVICWDRAFPGNEIVALVTADGVEYILPYGLNGIYPIASGSYNDLMIKE